MPLRAIDRPRPGTAARALALLLAAALAAGCATPTPVAFQPASSGGAATDSLAAGGAVRATLADGVRLAVHPTWRQQPLDGPAFTLRIANGSAVPVRIDRDAVRATFRGAPVPLASRAEQLRAVQAAEVRREVLVAVVGTLAVAAALWGIAAGWDGAIGAGSVAVQTPLGGLAAGIAVAGVGEEALQRYDLDDLVARRAVAEAILESRTVGPGQAATVQIVLERCCGSTIRRDDAIRIAVTVGGETARFDFLRVPSDDPTALLPP